MKVVIFIAVVFMVPGILPCDPTAGRSSASASIAVSPLIQQEMRAVTGLVAGQVLTSNGMPSVRMKFDKAFKYAGTQSFILYDVAHAEQHFFVDADKQGHIKRLYWVQFEGYLASNNNSYKYPVTKSLKIAGLDFVADAYARNIKANPGRANSDGSRMRAFLEGKGYRVASDEVISQRLVHLVDEAKRNELMIIYLEDLSAMGLTAADLAKDGKAADRWNQISTDLLGRALKHMEMSRP
jgi:hypothetical protein